MAKLGISLLYLNYEGPMAKGGMGMVLKGSGGVWRAADTVQVRGNGVGFEEQLEA